MRRKISENWEEKKGKRDWEGKKEKKLVNSTKVIERISGGEKGGKMHWTVRRKLNKNMVKEMRISMK